MASFNKVVMIGNLTRDPEYKQLASGSAVCRLGLASNRQYKNRQSGTMVQEVCFVDIDVFGPQADSCNQYLQKGRPVLIEGRLKFDTWQSPEGQTRSKHSIVADRVVFLSASAAGAFEQDDQGAALPDPSEVDIDQLRNKVGAKKISVKKTKVVDEDEDQNTGELDFNDEAPFEEDLPF